MANKDDDEKEKSIPDSVTETITFEAHMTPAMIGREMEKIAKCTNFLVGRMLLGAAFGSAGAAHPLAQQIIQCAVAAGSIAASIIPQNNILLPGQQQMRPGGRA